MTPVRGAFVAVLVVASAGAFREDLTIERGWPPRDLDNPNAPRDVHVLIAANKLSGISLIGGQFRLDFYIYFAWRDDRQTEMGAIPTDNSVWWPRPEIMNWEGGSPFNAGHPFSKSCIFGSGAPRFTQLSITEGKWCLCQARQRVCSRFRIAVEDRVDATVPVGLFIGSG
jgi:hypothetical protein